MLYNSVEPQNASEMCYLVELVNSIETGASLPDHEMATKKGFVVIRLRNIKPFLPMLMELGMS